MADANDTGTGSSRHGECPSATPSRSASAFLTEKEQAYARRDFLARSSVAAFVVAAGGVFLPGSADASIPASPPSRSAQLGAAVLAKQPAPYPEARIGAATGGDLVALHCSHASHGSHGSHGSW